MLLLSSSRVRREVLHAPSCSCSFPLPQPKISPRLVVVALGEEIVLLEQSCRYLYHVVLPSCLLFALHTRNHTDRLSDKPRKEWIVHCFCVSRHGESGSRILLQSAKGEVQRRIGTKTRDCCRRNQYDVDMATNESSRQIHNTGHGPR